MNPVSKVVSLLHSSALSGYRNCVFHFGEKNPDQLVEILLIHFLVIVFYICFICSWTWVCFYLKSFQTFLFSCFHLLTITKFKLSAWYVATSATEPMPKINILLSQFSSFQWLMCIHFVFKWLYNWRFNIKFVCFVILLEGRNNLRELPMPTALQESNH